MNTYLGLVILGPESIPFNVSYKVKDRDWWIFKDRKGKCIQRSDYRWMVSASGILYNHTRAIERQARRAQCRVYCTGSIWVPRFAKIRLCCNLYWHFDYVLLVRHGMTPIYCEQYNLALKDENFPQSFPTHKSTLFFSFYAIPVIA
jgi:hypothetical protein